MSDEILELIWNYMPDENDNGIGMDYYPAREGHDAELYFERDGRCYRILVLEHPHS